MKLDRVSVDADVVGLRVVDSVIRGDPSPDLNGVGDLLGERGYGTAAILSLADTEFIDSSGLSWLLECHKKFCDAGGRLVIHSVPPSVMDTLMMMRLELVLHLADDEAAALKLVRGEDA